MLPPASTAFPRSYVAAWVAAAVLSGTYISTVALTVIDGGRAEIAANSGPGDVMRAAQAAEARALKFKVALEEFQRDVAQLRTDGAGQADGGLLARLAAIEERLSIETGVAIAAVDTPALVGAVTGPGTGTGTDTGAAALALAPAAGSLADVASGVGQGGVNKPVATRVAGAVATAGPNGVPKVSIPIETRLETGIESRIETGSLQKSPPRDSAPATASATAASSASASATGLAPPSSPVGPVVLNSPNVKTAAASAAVAVAVPAETPAVAAPAAAKPFAVQLASGGSVESLRLSWSVLSEQHGDALGALQPRYNRSASTAEAGPIFDLVAGPFKTAADARKACKTLASRGTDCKISNFGGNGL